MHDETILEAFGPVAPYYDELMAAVPYSQWVEYIHQVWTAHRQEPTSVLDIACGTGTTALLLARQGYELTGVDLSPGMLQAARAKSDAAGIQIPWHQQDAAELDLGNARFDAALCLFDSLNNILDPVRVQEAFARIARHLNPGGSFFFDVNTEYALAEGMFDQSSQRHGDPLHYRWRSQYNDATRLCVIKMRFSYDPGNGVREVFHETHRQRAYSKEELTQWLQNAGFAKVFVYDAYTLQPAKKRSDRLFFFAIKGAIA